MKIEDLCKKLIKEFNVNVDVATHTELIHFALGVLCLAKKLDPHNKIIDYMLLSTNEEIKKTDAKAELLEYFFRYLDAETDGKADSVKEMSVTIESPKFCNHHQVIKIDYTSEIIEE